MKHAHFLAAAAISLLVAFAPACAAQPPRPNIVLIMADDMGFSDIGCYGSEIDTPNIDALASTGLRFTQFYNTGRCCPTRASLLTGLYPHQAGMGHMTGKPMPQPGYRAELSHDAVTLAELLRSAGYATYMAGKWHVTTHSGLKGPKDNWPRQRGFDRYYGTVMGGGNYFDPAMLTRDNTPISPFADPQYKPQGAYYYTTAIADQAARFVKEHQAFAGGGDRKPFFMYVAFTAPHWPLNAPADAIAQYKGKYDAGYAPIRDARLKKQHEIGLFPGSFSPAPLVGDWAATPNHAWESRCMEVYAAQVHLMDEGVGRVVAALKEAGALDNTLIIFLADNGGCAENQGRTVAKNRAPLPKLKPDDIQTVIRTRWTRDGRPVREGPDAMPGPDDTFIAYGQNWANVSNTPFREYKHFVHEGGISTPLIAHWPAGLQHATGQWIPFPAHLIDLMPTFAELAGATYPKTAPPMEGISLLPVLRGQPTSRPNPLFWEHEGNRAVRSGNWKLVAKGEHGPWELYDMTSDRAETHDLAKDHPDLVTSLSEQWTTWAKRADVLPLRPYAKSRAAAAATE